jgi:MAF protein
VLEYRALNVVDRMPGPKRIVLASASPRRRELLALGGWDFDLCPVDVFEVPRPDEHPADFVRRMSQTKARLAAHTAPPGALVIGADTTVALDGDILNKPADAREALAMLTRLRGRTHEVLTALTLHDAGTGREVTDLARSRVPLRDYADDEMRAYVASGDPLDKAGAYAIQHPRFQPVDQDRFADCFANVMGLPLCHLLRQLRRWGLEPGSDLPAACQDFLSYACPVSEAILREEVG